MPGLMPGPSDVHVNRMLNNVSIAYMQAEDAFVADKVFPVVPVQHQSDLYRIYTRDDWFRVDVKERAPATESSGGGWSFTNGQYAAKVYAHHKDVDDQTLRNADSEFNLDRDATEYVTRQLLLKREMLWQATYFGSGVWNQEMTGTASTADSTHFVKWSVAGSTPIEDLTAQKIKMARTTGYRPNKLVLAPDVFNALCNHAEILDRIKYTQRGIVTEEILAAVLGIEQVLVPWGVVNSAAEGATLSEDFIYGGAALLLYAAPRPGLLQQSAGYTFAWTAYSGYGARMKKYRIEQIESFRVEGDMAFDVKLVSPDLGAYFNTAV